MQQAQPLISRPGTQPGQNEEQVTPEEQAAYEYYSAVAQEFLLADETAQYIGQFFQESDPVQALGKVAAIVYARIDEQNKDKGGVPDEVAMDVIEDIITTLLDVALSRGYIDEAMVDQGGEQLLEQIFNTAYTEYMQIKEQVGELNPEEEAAKYQELVQSDVGQQAINAMSNDAAAQVKQTFGMRR